MASSMYDQVLLLPIFQGISYEQLTTLLEKVHFHFCKYADGESIVTAGEECEDIKFLISGEIQTITSTRNHKARVIQSFHAPFTLPFYCLFGMNTHHQLNVKAIGEAGIMTLSKQEFIQVLQLNPIMLINTMNILSSHAQKQHNAIDVFACYSREQRMAQWILTCTQRAAKSVEIEGDEVDLCHAVQMDVQTFQKSIDFFQSRGILEVENGKYKLLDRYALIDFVREKEAEK